MKRICLSKVLLAGVLTALAITAQAADRYWVASSADDWNNTANWSASSGGASGVSVPGSSDIAIFDGNGTGDCTIDTTVDVEGISILAGYSGEISQGAQEVTVGSSYFTQAGGTYTCGAGELKVDSFLLDGGTFTAPSSVLVIGDDNKSQREIVRVDPVAATFDHNNGTVRCELIYANSSSYDYTYDINTSSSTWTVYDLEYKGGDRNTSSDNFNNTIYEVGADDTIVVLGDLTMSPNTADNENSRLSVDGGRHKLHGNLILGNASTPAAQWAGLQRCTTIVEFMGTGDQTITSYPEHEKGPIVDINKDTGDVSTAIGFDDVTIGALILTDGTFNMLDGSTLTLNMSANSDQTLFDFGSNATFNASNVDMVFNPYYRNSSSEVKYYDIKLNGSMAVSNLTLAGGNTYNNTTGHRTRMQDGDKFIVGGNLVIQNGLDGDPDARILLWQGSIEVKGNLVVGNPVEPSGSTYKLAGYSTDISMVGSNDQTITHYYPGTNIISGDFFTINKTGGTVTLLSDMELDRTDQDLIWTAGGLDLGTNTLTVDRHVTIDTGATTLGVTVADDSTVGNIVAGGNASALDNVDLEVSVSATPDEVDGATYTILSNSTAVEEFAEVTWIESESVWRGIVDYT